MLRLLPAIFVVTGAVFAAAVPSALAQDTFVEEDEDEGAFVAEPEATPETAESPESPSPSASPGAKSPAANAPEASPDSDASPEVNPSPDADEPEPSAVAPKRPRTKPKTRTPAPRKPKVPPEETDVVPEIESPFQISLMSYDAVVERWDAYLKVLKAREVSRMRRFEGEFDQGRKNFGLHGLPQRPAAPAMGIAAALVAERKYKSGDINRGDEMMNRALLLAPDEPGVYLANARFALAFKNDGPQAVSSAIDAAMAAFRNPTARSTLTTWAMTLALLGFLFWLLLLSMVYLARSFRMLTFDLHSTLPRGAARWQVWILVVAAAIAPILAGLGPLLVALSWLTIAALYLARREQLFLLVIALICVAVPYISDLAVVGWTWVDSDVDRSYRNLFDVANADGRAKLKEVPAPQLNAVQEMALATEAKREGEIEAARVQWRSIVHRRPQDETAHASLGVVAGIVGEFDLAKAEFEASRKDNEDSKTSAFNLSLIHLRQSSSGKAQLEIAKVTGDRRLHEKFRAATFTGNDVAVPHNRAFVDPPLPSAPISALLKKPPPEAKQLSAEVRGIAWFGVSTTTAVGGAGIIFLLWLILLGVSERLHPSAPCRRCGTPASERYDGKDVPRGTCSGCYNVFESKTARIEPGRRTAKEVQIQHWRRSRHRIAVTLSLLWPGLGHLYAGATLIGAVLSLVYLPIVVSIFISASIFPWPGFSGLIDGNVFIGIFGFLALVVIALSTFLAHKKTE